jgi:dTDP-4-amino-4,6-dideoxygalactose transaminase|tara:strand:+ start:1012 stop:1260 length:249 start_codon:yes stop_codon:yes gene_type:complete
LNKKITRNLFVKQLNEKGIGASVHFYPPIHEQPFYKNYPEWIADDLVATENVSKSIVTLPLYTSMNKKELDKIIKEVKSILH